jgi:hypothetical protein
MLKPDVITATVGRTTALVQAESTTRITVITRADPTTAAITGPTTIGLTIGPGTTTRITTATHMGTIADPESRFPLASR